VASSASAEQAIGTALRADWSRLSSLEGVAIHRSLSGDSILAHAQWTGSTQDAIKGTETVASRIREQVTDCPMQVQVLTLHALRAGRAGRGSGDFKLSIDSHSGRPVLVAVFAPINRGALLQYLHEASSRFTEQVEGWHGAALYCDADDRRVVEYLQFESMEGVATSQGSPLIQQHQVALQKFGTMNANLYIVQDVYRRRTA